MAATTALAAALAIHYGALAIAVLSLIGGFLTPVLLSTNVDRPWALFGYLLLLDAGALALARVQRWRALEGLALGGTAVAVCQLVRGPVNGEKQTGGDGLRAGAAYALFALAGITGGAAGLADPREPGDLAIWAPPATTSLWIALVLAAAGWRWRNGAPGWLPRWWSSARSGLSPRRTRSTSAKPSPRSRRPSCCFWLGGVAAAGEEVRDAHAGSGHRGGEWRGILRAFLLPARPGYTLHGLLARRSRACTSRWGYVSGTRSRRSGGTCGPVLLLVGVALAFLTLAAPIQFSSYRITMAWAVEAARSPGSACARAPADDLRRAGVFLLTLARLYAVDRGSRWTARSRTRAS